MEKSGQKRHGNSERTYNIDIDAISKRHLRFFIEQETAYYNALVNDVTMRLRAFPEDVVNMRGACERLWAALAHTNSNLRALAKRPVEDWPTSVRQSLDPGLIVDGRLVLDERRTMIFDALNAQGKIHPNMRRSMAAEMLKLCITNAESLAAAHKSESGQMRNPVQMLLPAEPQEKRHIQLTKDLVKMGWDLVAKQTSITVPYTDRPLVIRDYNVTDERYTTMVIRQQSNGDANDASPWSVTFVHGPYRYLLDLRDQSANHRRRRVA